MERLSTALQAYHINALQQIADQLALTPNQKPVRKEWLVNELSRLIPRMARSKEYIGSLSQAERAALAIARLQEGTASFRDVAVPLVLAGLVRVDGYPETIGRPKVDDVLTALMSKGLLVNLSTPRSSSTLRTFAASYRFGIPAEVQSVLPSAMFSYPTPRLEAYIPSDSSIPAGIGHVAPPAASGVAVRDAQQFLRELLFAWTELRRQPARQLKAGGMGKRDSRRLAEALRFEGEPGLRRVAQLHDMLTVLNLVNQDGETITAVEGHAVTLFWGAKPVQHWRQLLRAYARLSTPLIQGSASGYLPGYYQGATQRPPTKMRELVLDTLERIVDLGWLSFGFFMILLTGGQPGTLLFDEEILEILSEHMRWYGGTYRGEMEASIQGAEYQIAQTAIAELQWMGIVDVSYQTSDNTEIAAIRATPVIRAYASGPRSPSDSTFPSGEAKSPVQGRSARGTSAAMSEEPPWQVVLQPDFQLLALGPVPLRVLANLEQFTEREKIDESVITYRLTRDVAYQALQRGETAESILAYLQEATEQPVPQNVQRSLEEWSRLYERIIVRRQTRILQVDRAELLEQLTSDPELSDWLHPLDDRTAWFRPEDTEQIEKRLFERKILIAQSHGAQADLPNSLKWHENELMPRAALPSLYVTGQLRRIAEARDGRWAMTPESIQAAIATGSDPLKIIAELQQMTGTDLPDGWEKLLKSWGGHFGDGETAEVRLLHLRRKGALGELRSADADLHRWLRPLTGDGDLAVVNQANWKEALERLATWGVEIEPGHWW